VDKLVTIALPVYKRLEYLPSVLKLIESQDYPAIELIVSDNGRNGPKVPKLVQANYSRPFRLRQNQETVSVAKHFNQIIEAAAGEYFVLLCDDDEISPNYVSELVSQIAGSPNAALAISAQEIINKCGQVIRRSKLPLPNMLRGPDFVLAAWRTYEFGFESFATYLVRTELLERCGGYQDWPRGNHSDNALLLQLCLLGNPVFSSRCVFRWRDDSASLGWTMPIQEFGKASRCFLRFLERDPILRIFADVHPGEWAKLRLCLREMTYGTYLWRWRDIYKKNLPLGAWIRGAFALPFSQDYYRQVSLILLKSLQRALSASHRRQRTPGFGPETYQWGSISKK
jgi:glycosyltransferase involved in cell wall biosynthesis